MRETMWRQPDDLRRVLARPRPGAARRRAHRRSPRAALRHGHELARGQPRRRAPAARRRRGLGGAGRRVRRSTAPAPVPATRSSCSATAARSTTRARRSRVRAPPAPRPCRSPRSARPAPTSRPASPSELRVHVQPPLRHRCACARSRARSAPISAASDDVPAAVAGELGRPGARRPAARAPAAVRGQRHERLGRGRGRAQDPRDRATSRPPATRWSTSCTGRASRSAAGDALVSLDGGGPGSRRAWPWSPTRAPATARASTASAATGSASRSRSSR